MSGLSETLGTALSLEQLKIVLGSCLFWFTVQAAAKAVSARTVPVYKLFTEDVQWRWNYTIAALFHSIVACALALPVVMNPDESLEDNPFYGKSSRAQFAFAVSTGYFVWDIVIVLSAEKLDIGFLVHAIACFFCYLFGQFPFLNYVGCWFLLFEVSTPFLSVRGLLLIAGYKDTKVYTIVQALFGLTFVTARLLIGLPISMMFWKDMYHLLDRGEQHSTFVVVYYLVANIALNALNVLWGSQIIRKGLGFGSKKSTHKPTVAKAVKVN